MSPLMARTSKADADRLSLRQAWLAKLESWLKLPQRHKIIRFLFASYMRAGFAPGRSSVTVTVLKFFRFNLLPMSGI